MTNNLSYLSGYDKAGILQIYRIVTPANETERRQIIETLELNNPFIGEWVEKDEEIYGPDLIPTAIKGVYWLKDLPIVEV